MSDEERAEQHEDNDEVRVAFEHRAWLRDAYERTSTSYDKAVMTLAGGALAISLTFIHNVAPKFQHKGYLGLSWAALAASLLLIFSSFWVSQRSLLSDMAKMDSDDPGVGEPGEGPWKVATEVVNVAAGLAFVLGVVFLVLFAWHNV